MGVGCITASPNTPYIPVELKVNGAIIGVEHSFMHHL